MKTISTLFMLATAALSFECAADLVLESDSIRLAFSETNGALVGASAPMSGWTFHRRATLGRSWRLLVPIGDEIRDNPVEGIDQRTPEMESGENFLRFTWKGVTSARGDDFDIDVMQEIRTEGEDVVWYTRIVNRSPYIVESVHSPIIGDLTRPEGSERFTVTYPSYAQAGEFRLWPEFDGNQGDWGIEHPTHVQYGPAAVEPFNLISNGREGLHLGIKAKSYANVFWTYELEPGFDESMSLHIPETDEFAGQPVHTSVSAVHQPYVMPDETRELTPIRLVAYTGGWEDGADVYKRWITPLSKSATAPAWAREPHSWLQVHVNSPEDELRVRYTDIPAIAEECAANDVRAIQLVGWNAGGQDRGNPVHDTDPRLGTREELIEAVKACEQLGVKLIIFSKFTWADRSREDYPSLYEPLAITDPYGGRWWSPGYAYFTTAQYTGINLRRFAPMCFGSERYLDLCMREFAKVADLGAPGFLYDECQHHGGALACFDTTHGHTYGWPIFANDRELIRRFRAKEGLRDDFLFAGEACYDWEYEVYHLAYFRSRYANHLPLQRYIRPDVQLMTSIVGYDDRDMVNQCLLDRYIISYEPRYFHGRLSDFPMTVAYGRRMNALRTELRQWLWDGEFRSRKDAAVTLADGSAHPHFARFEAADSSSMLVVCNYSAEPITVNATIGLSPVSEGRLVEDDGFSPLNGTMTIPAHSAAVLR